MIAAEQVLTRATSIKAQPRRRTRVRRAVASLVIGLGVVALTVTPLAVSARDMTGKGGLGLLQSSHPQMSRLPTLLFRYWGAKSCWELLVGFDLVRDRSTTAVYFKTAPTTQVFMLDTAVPDGGAANPTVDHVEPWFFDTAHIFVGLGVHRMVHSSSNLSVTLGARAVAQFTSTENKARTDTTVGKLTSALALLAEVPLQAEYFLSDHSSISASVAITASISSSFDATSDKDGGLVELLGSSGADRGGAAVQLGGRYSGGLGFTYYF